MLQMEKVIILKNREQSTNGPLIWVCCRSWQTHLPMDLTDNRSRYADRWVEQEGIFNIEGAALDLWLQPWQQ
jgi:hypothetical protein